MIFKFGRYGHTLEVRREMYRSMYKTLAIRVPDSVDHDRIMARGYILLAIDGLDKEIQRQYELHPEDQI